eukprot:CAMPEP_0114576480 /NCGR_PEP_ID=MMETSP0125-20121206/1236_1 /TAXON_ID=485358 ORGANISM="Aristerostoma sp., Strain ATCC 50986" /NCGR_SAMPLE_ID=MMETSP0125 /ASSEMBLY_ACC=CAM_ASM_000245 /LENGTH=85 /DNA_ID=CAMNT_0001765025 /DNA_START=365 /DNA_END=622 /DNA_ORIENTATION=-
MSQQNATKIFKSAIVDHLHNKKKATVMLVLQDLKKIRDADRILLVDKGLVIENQASIDDFLKSTGYMSSLLEDDNSNEKDNDPKV